MHVWNLPTRSSGLSMLLSSLLLAAMLGGTTCATGFPKLAGLSLPDAKGQGRFKFTKVTPCEQADALRLRLSLEDVVNPAYRLTTDPAQRHHASYDSYAWTSLTVPTFYELAPNNPSSTRIRVQRAVQTQRRHHCQIETFSHFLSSWIPASTYTGIMYLTSSCVQYEFAKPTASHDSNTRTPQQAASAIGTHTPTKHFLTDNDQAKAQKVPRWGARGAGVTAGQPKSSTERDSPPLSIRVTYMYLGETSQSAAKRYPCDDKLTAAHQSVLKLGQVQFRDNPAENKHAFFSVLRLNQKSVPHSDEATLRAAALPAQLARLLRPGDFAYFSNRARCKPLCDVFISKEYATELARDSGLTKDKFEADQQKYDEALTSILLGFLDDPEIYFKKHVGRGNRVTFTVAGGQLKGHRFVGFEDM